MPTDNFSTLPFSQCISKISIKHKIKQKDYLASGKYPVIDQGQSFISGYCDDEIAIKIKKPVIIFGDHTRCFKFVDFDFVAGADGIHILEPKDFFNEKLFYYFCLALDFPNKGYSRHFQYLAKTTMKIPPLETQKRIVARLESAFEKIEKGSAHLQDAKTKLAKYKQSLLKSAFDGTLTAAASLQGVEKAETIHKVDCHDLTSSKLAMTDKENPKLPQGWTIKTLGEVFKVVGGGTPSTAKTEFWNGNIAWITSADIDLQGFIITPKRFITNEAIQSSTTNCVEKDTIIVVTRVGLGKVGITDRRTCFSQDSQALIPLENVNVKFMAFQIKNQAKNFISVSRGTTINGITKNTLKELKLVVPPLETQKQIVKLLEKHLQHADKTGEFIESALNKAKQLKQSLLKSAFLGELV